MTNNDKFNYTFYCSFCGKNQYEVLQLICGPVVLICNECVTDYKHVNDEHIHAIRSMHYGEDTVIEGSKLR